MQERGDLTKAPHMYLYGDRHFPNRHRDGGRRMPILEQFLLGYWRENDPGVAEKRWVSISLGPDEMKQIIAAAEAGAIPDQSRDAMQPFHDAIAWLAEPDEVEYAQRYVEYEATWR